MAKKFLFVDNTTGDYTEALAYEVADHISVSAGAADAGKPIVLDADGQIDASMINDADIDHGNLTGLLDDDHIQYILVDGTRPFTGDQSMGGFKLTNLANGLADTDAINLGQLKAYFNGFDWKQSVRVATTADINLASMLSSIDGVTLVSGDRILVKNQVLGETNGIYLFNGVGVAATRTMDADSDVDVTAGLTVAVEEGAVHADQVWMLVTNNPIVLGTTVLEFSIIPVNTFIGGDGISIVGQTISVDLLDVGSGLYFVGGELAIEFATDFTIDAADELALKASDLASTDLNKGATIVGVRDAAGYYAANQAEGVLSELATQIGGTTSTTYDFTENNELADNDSIYPALNKLDLAFGDLYSTALGEGASLIGINDAGNYTLETNVESALQEIYFELENFGTRYLAGVGGVAKGDLVYISGNNTVLPYSDITSGFRVPGIAMNDALAGETVKILANDVILKTVLTGATAGARYYWDGTDLITTIPNTAGDHVWVAGIAKNATDLHVEVTFLKKNA